jgi:VanZ family protein
LSLVPGEDRPHLTAVPGLEHAGAYMIAAFLMHLACHRRVSGVWIVALLTAYGALFEILQLWVPDRNGQAFDAMADFVGASIGVLMAVAAVRLIAKAVFAKV